VDLHPLIGNVAGIEDTTRLYTSFDQIFKDIDPAVLSGDPGGEPSVDCRRLTCWGSGKVNLKRADLPVLSAVLGQYLNDSQLQALDAMRREMPDAGVYDLLRRLQLTKTQLGELIPLVSTGPIVTVYGYAPKGRGTMYRLFVEEDWAEGTPGRTSVFAW